MSSRSKIQTEISCSFQIPTTLSKDPYHPAIYKLQNRGSTRFNELPKAGVSNDCGCGQIQLNAGFYIWKLRMMFTSVSSYI